MPFDLIYSRNGNYTELSRENLQQDCPAAFSNHASPELSERYGFVSTANAIDILADHGFAPVRAIQKPVRKAGQLPFADHMVAFKPLQALEQGGQESPEILLYNSHNGKSSLRLYVGIFRFVCSNGLVAGEGFSAKLRHSRLTAASFSDLVIDQAQALPDLLERAENMKGQFLRGEQVKAFALQAASLRWDFDPNDAELGREYQGELRGAFANFYTLRDMTQARRFDDRGADLWRVFNRVQESLIRGGVSILSYTDRKPDGTLRQAKAVQSLPETVRINRNLWDLADAIA